MSVRIPKKLLEWADVIGITTIIFLIWKKFGAEAALLVFFVGCVWKFWRR